MNWINIWETIWKIPYHIRSSRQRCSIKKKVFLEILQNSQVHICAIVSFLIKFLIVSFLIKVQNTSGWLLPSHGLTYKRVLLTITWFSILLWKTGNSTAVYSVKYTYHQLQNVLPKVTKWRKTGQYDKLWGLLLRKPLTNITRN